MLGFTKAKAVTNPIGNLRKPRKKLRKNIKRT